MLHNRIRHYVQARYKAIRVDELPERYRTLPVIGRGQTSIAVAKNDDTVLMFTRDSVKVDWLRKGTFGLELGDVVEIIEPKVTRIKALRELPIYVVELPRLEKLDSANKKIVRNLLKEFERVSSAVRNAEGWHREQTYRGLVNHYTDDSVESHILYRLFMFLANYDVETYWLDLSLSNFAQTKDGIIVVLDPVVSADVMTYVQHGGKQVRS